MKISLIDSEPANNQLYMTPELNIQDQEQSSSMPTFANIYNYDQEVDDIMPVQPLNEQEIDDKICLLKN